MNLFLNIDSDLSNSIDHVSESCNGSNRGGEVAACYNSIIGKVFYSKSIYPLNTTRSVKIDYAI